MRTDAAPTYSPSRSVFIDGGVFANDPAMCALAEALGSKIAAVHPEGRRYRIEEVSLLSIGTGAVPCTWDAKEDLGWLGWAASIPSLMIESAQGTAAYQCEAMLGARYQRINAVLPRAMELDDVESIPELLRLADSVDLSRAVEWARAQW